MTPILCRMDSRLLPLLMLLCSAWASADPVETMAPQAAGTAATAETMAHVHIYRPSKLTGMAVDYDVALDNLLGSLPNDGVLSRDLAPGPHELTVDRPAPPVDKITGLFYKPKAPTPAHLEFEAAPGGDYYFVLNPVFLQDDRIETVPADEGARAVTTGKIQTWKLEAPEKLPSPTHLLPGNSLGDYLLQRNIVSFIYKSEMAFCTNVHLTDTKVIAMPKKLGSSPWKETWTFSACGEQKVYELELLPTANGTQVAMKAD